MSLGYTSRRIYQYLFKRINGAEWSAGEQLPTEKALCAEFAVSRTTVRQALKQLAADGVIHSRQGAGYFMPVKPATVNNIAVMHHGNADEIRVIQNRLLKKKFTMTLFSQRQLGWDRAIERTFLQAIKEQRHPRERRGCGARSRLRGA